MKRFKALSVKQPWAALIANGRKTIETRKWATNYRGPLLICSSKSADRNPQANMHWIAQESAGLRVARFHLLDRGVAVCLVDLMGCTRTYDCSVLELDELAKKACCEVTPFMWCWHLENVRRLKAPLPTVKGQLGLYKVELERLVFE